MTDFVNPFKPRSGTSYADALARIRAWTKAAIPAGDAVISVNELACAEPGCPPRETVVLVMWPDAPAWKIRMHNAMPDVTEEEVVVALGSIEVIGKSSSRSKGA